MKTITSKVLLKDLRELINAARQDVARQVNSSLVLLYWRVGKRIHQDILQEKRAEYGEQIVSALRRELSWTHLKQIIYLDDPLEDESIRCAVNQILKSVVREICTLRSEGVGAPIW